MRVYVGFILVFVLFSCRENQNEISVITSVGDHESQVVNEIFTPTQDFKIEKKVSVDASASLDSVRGNKARLAIVENFTPYQEGIRTIFPLYEKILHIFYHKDISAASFKDLCEGRIIYIGEKGSSTRILANKLFETFDIDLAKVNISENVLDKADVLFVFKHVMEEEDLLGMEDYKLFSFDKLEHIGKGSIIEAVHIRNPHLSPYIIPNQLYNEITPTPILTLSSVALLVGSKDLLRSEVYEIIEMLKSGRMQFGKKVPALLIGLNKSYSLNNLNFPPHESMLDYLGGSKLTFVEKYAEVVLVILLAIAAFGVIVVASKNWKKKSQKNQVDEFYTKILNIKKASESTENAIEIIQLVNEIQFIQNQAFELLMDEKLVADESFRIFMELAKDALSILEDKIESLTSQSMSSDLVS